MSTIGHPDILWDKHTCYGCPDQWEGQLKDGRYFYFRFRHSRASLAVGDTRESVSGAIRQSVMVCPKDEDRGIFNSAQERRDTFATLLKEEAGR